MINSKQNVFKSKKSELCFIGICSLMLLAFCALTIAYNKAIFGGDVIPYIDAAENVAQGKGFITNFALSYEKDIIPAPFSWWQPLFPILISFFIKIGVDSLVAAFLVSGIFLGLIPFVLFYLAKGLYGSKVAYISVFYLTFYFPLIQTAAVAQTESMYIFFVLLTLLFLSKIEYLNTAEFNLKNKKLLFLSGISMGLAYLTRGNGLWLFPLPIICIYWLSQKLNNFRETINSIIALLFGFLAISSPWLIRNYILFRAPFYYGQYFFFHPPYLKSIFWILYRIDLDLAPLIFFVPYSIKYLTTEECKKCILVILYPLISIFFFTTWAAYSTRLLMPIYPLLIVIGFKTLLDIISLFEAKFKKISIISNHTLKVILMAMIAVPLLPNFVSMRHFVKTPPLITINSIKKSTDWIKNNINKDDVILSNLFHAYYLTKIKMVWTAERAWPVPEDYSTLRGILKRFNIKFVVLYKNQSSADVGDYLYGLQNGLNIPPEFAIVYNEKDAIIYKVNRGSTTGYDGY